MLRPVAQEDLGSFFEHQRDPVATALAAFAARGRTEFDAHWARLLEDDSNIVRTVLSDRAIVGHVCCFGEPGGREVAYWIDRVFWGRGLATEALGQFVEQLRERPLHATVAEHNAPSMRVLEKCGFRRRGAPRVADDGVVEIMLELDGLGARTTPGAPMGHP